MNGTQLRIMVVDDHAIVREGLKRLVAGMPDAAVVGEAADGAAALRSFHACKPNLVVVDISLPGRWNGFDVIREMKSRQPRLKVLVLSMHPADQYARRVLKTGANGYVTKDSAPDQLMVAIRRAARGDIYLGPGDGRLASEMPGAAIVSHEMLSDREFHVLCRFGSGLTAGQIAAELDISIKTVSTYRARIMEKMHFRTSAELVAYAIRNNLAN